MTIQDLIFTKDYYDAKTSEKEVELTYLIFGGQGSVYISSIEYCPAKKQLKLLSESKETYQGPVKLTDLLIYPKDTEILIEGYPGDEEHPLEWVTPDFVEFSKKDNTLDFQHLLDDSQRRLLKTYENKFSSIIDKMEQDDIPDDIIKDLLLQLAHRLALQIEFEDKAQSIFPQ